MTIDYASLPRQSKGVLMMAVGTRLGRDEDGGNEFTVPLIFLQTEAGETVGVEGIATICDS